MNEGGKGRVVEGLIKEEDPLLLFHLDDSLRKDSLNVGILQAVDSTTL